MTVALVERVEAHLTIVALYNGLLTDIEIFFRAKCRYFAKDGLNLLATISKALLRVEEQVLLAQYAL
jgi:hypothetical protein